MYCWERDIYIKLISEYQERKKQNQAQTINGVGYYPI
jgi:uncharacterized protein YcbK (DUF882 family)